MVIYSHYTVLVYRQVRGVYRLYKPTRVFNLRANGGDAMNRQISAFFGGGLLHRSGCDRFEVLLKSVVVRLKLARLVDELLALRSRICFRFRGHAKQYGGSTPLARPSFICSSSVVGRHLAVYAAYSNGAIRLQIGSHLKKLLCGSRIYCTLTRTSRIGASGGK